MKLLILISMMMNVYIVEGALVVASPRQAEENLSPRLQAIRDSGKTLENRILQRAQSLRELKEERVIAALKNSAILTIGPRRNSVSEGSCLKNIPTVENKEEN